MVCVEVASGVCDDSPVLALRLWLRRRCGSLATTATGRRGRHSSVCVGVGCRSCGPVTCRLPVCVHVRLCATQTHLIARIWLGAANASSCLACLHMFVREAVVQALWWRSSSSSACQKDGGCAECVTPVVSANTKNTNSSLVLLQNELLQNERSTWHDA